MTQQNLPVMRSDDRDPIGTQAPKLTLREWHVIYFLTSQCRVTGDL